MPFLTSDTLADLARRTRRYLYRIENAPLTTADLNSLPQTDGRTVWVLTFGPSVPPMPSTPFRSLFAVGLMDLPRRAASGFTINGVCPIEEQLADLLTEYPSDKGYALVVVPAPRGVIDVWDHAERTDDDARQCACRVAAINPRRGATA